MPVEIEGAIPFERDSDHRSYDRAFVHRFRRILVLIAGGSHPRFARNLGTGEPLISGRQLASATHAVHLGDGGTSRLVLPAAPRPPAPR